jgi:hypothetical protein
MSENKKWLSDKDCLAFFFYCDSAVSRSKFKGSFGGGDIAMRVMNANEGKSLEELKKLVPAAINAEFNEGEKAKKSPELNDQQECDAKTNWKFKIKVDVAFGRKHQDDKNRWAREDIANNTEHSKYRRERDKLRKREKARVKARKIKVADVLDKQIARRVKLAARNE